MSKTSRTEPGTAIPPRITPAALALWARAEARKVADDLGGIGIPVLMLKGPDLQMRLYGTPVAYASGTVIDRYLEQVRVGLEMHPSGGDVIHVHVSKVRPHGGGEHALATGDQVELELLLQASDTVDDAVIGVSLSDGEGATS